MSTWSTVKAYTAQAAEAATAPTTPANVPGLPRNQHQTRLLEFRLDAPSTTGTPTSISLAIWRKVNEKWDYLTTWTIAQTDITNGTIAPLIVETYGCDVMTRLSFTGGTTPTLTATVQGRALE